MAPARWHSGFLEGVRSLLATGRKGRKSFMANLRLRRDSGDGITETDLAMMERAITLAARAAEAGEVPVGAVVYKGTRIIAEAANNRESTRDPVGHAELLAMSKAGKALGDWRLTDCSLAVTLEPCPMCAGAMINGRLGRLVYGTDDPKAGAVKTLYRMLNDERLNHRVTVIGGVLAGKCQQQLRAFFRERRAANKSKRGLNRAG